MTVITVREERGEITVRIERFDTEGILNMAAENSYPASKWAVTAAIADLDPTLAQI